MDTFSYSRTIVLGALLGFTACGPVSDTREITLLSSLPSKTKEFNLQRQLTTVSNAQTALPEGWCLQKQMRLLVKTTPDDDGDEVSLDTFPFALYTKLGSAFPNDPALQAGWLNANVQIESELKVNIPKVGQSQVGIAGIIYEPIDANGDGVCDDRSGVDARNSLSLFAHRTVPLKSGESISMKVFTLSSNPVVTPTPPAYSTNSNGNSMTSSGAYYCEDPKNPTFNTCPVRDFLEIRNVTNVPTEPPRVESVSYLPGKNGTPPLVHYFNVSAPRQDSSLFIPHVYPIKLTYNWGGGNKAEIPVRRKTKVAQGTPPPPATAAYTTTITVNEVGNQNF